MEVIRNVKGLLLEVSIDDLHSSDIKEDQLEGESCLNRSIIDELHFSDIQGDQIGGKRSVTRSFID